MTTIQEITNEELKSETSVAPWGLTVRLMGNAETASMGDLSGFLKRLHLSAVEAKISEIVVDLRALEFMNSSCLKAFVSWLNTLEAAPTESQYRVRFIGDDRKHWQNRSLGALACFAVDLIRVEP